MYRHSLAGPLPASGGVRRRAGRSEGTDASLDGFRQAPHASRRLGRCHRSQSQRSPMSMRSRPNSLPFGRGETASPSSHPGEAATSAAVWPPGTSPTSVRRAHRYRGLQGAHGDGTGRCSWTRRYRGAAHVSVGLHRGDAVDERSRRSQYRHASSSRLPANLRDLPRFRPPYRPRRPL